jgi:hypothetical protein
MAYHFIGTIMASYPWNLTTEQLQRIGSGDSLALKEALESTGVVTIDKSLLYSVISLLQSSQRQAGGVEWAKERDSLLRQLVATR